MLFQPGMLVATPGALAALGRSGQSPADFLRRHNRGDWGEVDGHDRQANWAALREGGRLLSSYRTPRGEEVWVITEAGELLELLRQRSRALRWAVDDGVLAPIASRSRGTPRLALRLLQACRRVCRSEGAHAITTGHLGRACALEQIDGLGLGPTDRQYLLLLAEGASRLNVLTFRLGLPARTVAEVTEPFLIRAGPVAKDDQGRRQLTAEGREHLSQSCADGV
jgi:hypothetical protein